MKTTSRTNFIAVVFAMLASCAGGQMPQPATTPTTSSAMTPVETYRAGKALWEEKCRTVAGEKIYRTVYNVEGVLLMNIRTSGSSGGWEDPNWPGAAFAREKWNDGYIITFLGYETHPRLNGKRIPFTRESRGYFTTTYDPNDAERPGYRWVDVIDEKDGKRWRYKLVQKPRPTSKIGWIDIVLDKTPAPDPAPRYGVTFEDHVVAEERALGVASSTLKVIDLKTNEVMGELTRYVLRGTRSSANPSPWLTAYQCPSVEADANVATRPFVDQILIPKKDEN